MDKLLWAISVGIVAGGLGYLLAASDAAKKGNTALAVANVGWGLALILIAVSLKLVIAL